MLYLKDTIIGKIQQNEAKTHKHSKLQGRIQMARRAYLLLHLKMQNNKFLVFFFLFDHYKKWHHAFENCIVTCLKSYAVQKKSSHTSYCMWFFKSSQKEIEYITGYNVYWTFVFLLCQQYFHPLMGATLTDIHRIDLIVYLVRTYSINEV